MAQVQILVDRTACAGHGMCYGTSPDLIDCDDEGYPILPERPLSDTETSAAQAAAAACPERALSLVDASTASGSRK
ncbi:ferredoxin [Gordonia sp. HY002]|uniref:ferredoxin n=1 Tax=Gordonia zhenghanii TaxID=2911516 RepID=UPI001EF0A904|nr:ferredoxin [Gordonia zhenghanii]MCF8571304.1 ferredoxin [Gordonia zhenghanii]MCF8601828.1 ferredoxin [Gordonia zhenghanii]